MSAGAADPPALRAVVLDMDGVVVDSEPVSLEVIAELLAEHGSPVEEDALRALVGVPLATVMGRVAAMMPVPVDVAPLLAEYRRRYLPRLEARATATPGLRELIDGVRSAGWGLAMATSSSPAEARVVLRALDLVGRFDVVVTAADVARPKPAPDLYLLATARLAVAPHEAIAVEDSSSGLRAALAARVTCVAVATATSRGQDHAGAALVVSSLTELSVDRFRLVHREASRSWPAGRAPLRSRSSG